MYVHWTHHHHRPSTNGAPQVVAAGFAAMVVLMLLLPLAQVSFAGAVDARPLVFLLKTDTGFNPFALLLLLAPVVGIAEAMLARSAWRGASAAIAVVAVVMIPLTLLTLNRGLHHTVVGNLVSVAPGMGSYVLLTGYLILAIATGTAAFRARHDDEPTGELAPPPHPPVRRG